LSVILQSVSFNSRSYFILGKASLNF